MGVELQAFAVRLRRAGEQAAQKKADAAATIAAAKAEAKAKEEALIVAEEAEQDTLRAAAGGAAGAASRRAAADDDPVAASREAEAVEVSPPARLLSPRRRAYPRRAPTRRQPPAAGRRAKACTRAPSAKEAAAAGSRPVAPRCPRPPRRRRWPRRHRRRGRRRPVPRIAHDGKVDGEVAGAACSPASPAVAEPARRRAGTARWRGLGEAVEPLVALIKSSADPDEVGAAAAAVAAISGAHLPAAQAAARAGIAPSLAKRLDGAAAVDCASALGALVEVGGIGSREMHAAGGLLKLVAMLQPTAGADATATAGLQIDTKLRAGGAQQRDVFRELRGIKLLGTALAVGASAATPAAPGAPLPHRRPRCCRRRPPHQPAGFAAGALPALVAVARRLAVRRAPPEPELLPNAVLAIGSVIDGLSEGGAALKGGDGVELLVSLLRVQPPTETSALAMDALRGRASRRRTRCAARSTRCRRGRRRRRRASHRFG